MTITQKVDLVKAVCLVAEFWEIKPVELVSLAALIANKEKKEEWNKIVKEVQGFAKMDINEKARLLGIERSKYGQK